MVLRGNKRFIFYLIIYSISVLSCHQRPSSDAKNKIKINTEESFATADIIKTTRLTPIETTDSVIVVDIDNISIFDDRIHILDEQQKTLFVFDTNGRFLNKLNRVGRGPDEYIMMNDFFIEDSSGNIIILDSYSSRCKVYDRNFNHLKDIKLSANSFNYLMPVNDSLLALYSMVNGTACLYNHRLGEIVQELSVSNEELEFKTPFKSHRSPFKYYEGEYYLLASAKKEIYRITSKGFELKYSFSFGKKEGDPYSLQISAKDDIISLLSFNNEIIKTNKIFAVIDFIETDNFILLTGNNYSVFYYEKNTNKSGSLDKEIWCDAVHNKVIYETMPIQDIPLAIQKERITVNEEYLDKILTLPSDSNPILISYTLK